MNQFYNSKGAVCHCASSLAMCLMMTSVLFGQIGSIIEHSQAREPAFDTHWLA